MKNLYLKRALYCLFLKFGIILCLISPVYAQEFMSVNLYQMVNGNPVIVDGNLTDYDNIYSNNIDQYDAWKLTNSGVNFGIYRQGIDLVVERRTRIVNGDTTFFKMWNMAAGTYRIKFVLKNLTRPGMRGFLRDNSFDGEFPVALDDTTYIDFVVNSNTLTSDPRRFDLVMEPIMGPLSSNAFSFQAVRKGKTVNLQWKESSEQANDIYELETSSNGTNFTVLTSFTATPQAIGSTYTYSDSRIIKQWVYYRIKQTKTSGQIRYSTILSVKPGASLREIQVFPNPIVNKSMNCTLIDFESGVYSLQLFNIQGAKILSKSVPLNHSEQKLQVQIPGNVPAGLYRLKIEKAGSEPTIKTIQIL